MLGLKPIGPLVWVVIVAVLIVVLYFAGGAVTKQSIDIAGCHAEWDTITRTVQSSLCPNASAACSADPYVTQHNAIVDALLCACAKAAPDYVDATVNKQITDAYAANTNVSLTVREVCEGGQLAKWLYRG